MKVRLGADLISNGCRHGSAADGLEHASVSAPLFSIIVPFRNAAATLPHTLRSVQAQNLRDWEALLVDDGSSDRGPALVAELARQDTRIRLLQEDGMRPRGAAATRNLGIRASRGRYIAFLDADDLWTPDKLARQLIAFEGGASLVFSSYRRIDMEGRALSVVRAKHRVAWADALGGNPIGCLTGTYDTRRYGRAEMPLLPMHEDYAFWLGLLRKGESAHGLQEVLAEYRVRPGSLSANKIKGAMAVWRILAAEGVGPLRRTINFAHYAKNAVWHRL